MGFFSDILEKLGVGTDAPTEAVASSLLDTSPDEVIDDEESVIEESGAVTPVAFVDVVAHLEALADANPQKLNWRTSIVDLLKLLGLDSSLAARKELAIELNCDEDVMADSAHMNMWLHKEVLTRIAANGGNIPDDVLN